MNASTFARIMAARFGRDRWNEHMKLIANLLNATAVACVVGAFVAPLINSLSASPDIAGQLLISGMILHFAAQAFLRYIVTKD